MPMGTLDILAEHIMQPIIYDVAVSIDGFVAGHDGDISQFAHDGAVVDDYFARLSGYAVAIMGRRTYEFGYRFGLQPGANPYPNMETHVFSRSIDLPEDRAVAVIETLTREYLDKLKKTANGPIYLCGGGDFAGAVLELGLIDVLRLKRAPILFGAGTRLFGGSCQTGTLTNTLSRRYENGYVFQEFEVRR